MAGQTVSMMGPQVKTMLSAVGPFGKKTAPGDFLGAGAAKKQRMPKPRGNSSRVKAGPAKILRQTLKKY